MSSATPSIEARLRGIEDRLEIYTLIAAHPPSADTGAAFYSSYIYLEDGEFGRGESLPGAVGARAGSHPCQKQAVAITQDAGDPPRGRAIRIPAGEIIARRTVPAGWGHGWGWFSYFLII